jgi:hypothetical protein
VDDAPNKYPKNKYENTYEEISEEIYEKNCEENCEELYEQLKIIEQQEQTRCLRSVTWLKNKYSLLWI